MEQFNKRELLVKFKEVKEKLFESNSSSHYEIETLNQIRVTTFSIFNAFVDVVSQLIKREILLHVGKDEYTNSNKYSGIVYVEKVTEIHLSGYFDHFCSYAAGEIISYLPHDVKLIRKRFLKPDFSWEFTFAIITKEKP